MEFEALLPPLGGVIVGWLLGELSSWIRGKREWKQDILRIKLDSYAEWAAGMESQLKKYATQSAAAGRELNPPRSEKRLLLLERDPKARRLLESIKSSVPELDTAEFRELRNLAVSSPDWDWPPFRRSMNDLLDYVRKSL